jgi:hypothetical protein
VWELTSEDLLVSAPVSRASDFASRFVFQEGQEGPYSLQVFLFWPDAPPQMHARCTLSPGQVVP